MDLLKAFECILNSLFIMYGFDSAALQSNLNIVFK